MRVKGIAWVGIQTDRFEEMQAMLAAVLGVPPPVEEDGFALWSLPNGDGYASVHLRAPDGTIFELVLDPAHETRSRP